MIYFNFFEIAFISFFLNGLMIIISKDITFFGDQGTTDNEKMLIAASKHNLLSFPSTLHLIENSRAQLREFWVIALSIIMKLTNQRVSEFVNIILSLLCNSFNAVLVFYISIEIFTYEVAILIFFLYLTSFWSYQIAIYLGHILMSTTFCLLSIFLLTFLKYDFSILDFSLCFLIGFSIIVCFSSSSASRKYPPFIIFFFIFDYFNKFFLNSNQQFINFFILGSFLIIMFYFILNKILSKTLLNFFKKNNKKISDLKEMVIRQICNYLNLFVLFLLFNLNSYFIFQSFSLFIYGLLITTGSLIAIAYLLYPNFADGIKRYLIFLNIGYWANHFQVYPKGFFNITSSKKFRGGGYSWVYKLFLRVSPVVFALYIFSAIYRFYLQPVINSSFIFENLFALLPLLVIELTKGIRVGKSYFPCLVGFLFGIGFNFSEIILYTINFNIFYFFLIAIILNSLISLYALVFDIIPSRRFQVNLKNYLKKNGLNSFATYKNPYMQGTLNPLIESLNDIQVEYVESIEKSKNDIFIVPPISSKSVSFETNSFVIKNGDFNKDSILNQILKDQSYKKCILKEFKTFGSSRYFVLESEVTGYRELELKEIKKYDRYLGKCRIISKRKLKNEILL